MFALHHVQLAMPRDNESEARVFYGRLLGMREVEKPPRLAARGGCWFRKDGVELHLGVEDDFRPARKAHPGIVVDDLDDLCVRLTDAGHRADPDDDFPGFRRAYTDDPFGNRLEFLQPVDADAATFTSWLDRVGDDAETQSWDPTATGPAVAAE